MHGPGHGLLAVHSTVTCALAATAVSPPPPSPPPIHRRRPHAAVAEFRVYSSQCAGAIDAASPSRLRPTPLLRSPCSRLLGGARVPPSYSRRVGTAALRVCGAGRWLSLRSTRPRRRRSRASSLTQPRRHWSRASLSPPRRHQCRARSLAPPRRLWSRARHPTPPRRLRRRARRATCGLAATSAVRVAYVRLASPSPMPTEQLGPALPRAEPSAGQRERRNRAAHARRASRRALRLTQPQRAPAPGPTPAAAARAECGLPQRRHNCATTTRGEAIATPRRRAVAPSTSAGARRRARLVPPRCAGSLQGCTQACTRQTSRAARSRRRRAPAREVAPSRREPRLRFLRRSSRASTTTRPEWSL